MEEIIYQINKIVPNNICRGLIRTIFQFYQVKNDE